VRITAAARIIRSRSGRRLGLLRWHYELAAECFLIRGFDPRIDAIDDGRELILLARKLVAERQQAKVAAQ